MERRRRKFILLILSALCLFALAAGVLLGAPRAEACGSSEEKNAETLRNTDPAEIAALERYDSRDYGIVTPVKNQSNDPLCWSYATVAACETSILREGLEGADAETLDLDERNLGWWANNPRTDEFHLIDGDVPEGNGLYSTGGAMEVAGKTFLQWMGPSVQAERDENSIKNAAPSPYRLEGMFTFDYSVENVKAAVAKYGAVSFSYYFYHGAKIFDHLNNAGEAKINPHSSIIVGWDDTVPASVFTPAPSAMDGGWIVKNSWGADRNLDGYFYLSYDSQIFDVRAFDCTEASEFDHQYLYNGVIKQGVSKMRGTADGVKAAAIYRAQGGTETTSEMLTAVNIGIGGTDVGVEISIYKQPKADFTDLYWRETDPEDGEFCTRERFTGVGEGYHTFRLKEAMPLENGETFSVVVRAQNGAGNASVYFTEDTKSDNDMTFLLENDGWRNGKRYNAAAHIRAYTVDTVRTEPLPVRDLQRADVVVAAGNYRYSGSEITPDVMVTLGGKTLRKGTDYTIRYENNVFASDEAAAIVVGVAPYTGEKSVTFTIEKAQEPPRLVLPEKIEREEGMETLGDIGLPAGWRWTDESAPLALGTVRAMCEYVGADAGNYAVRTREATFELVEKTAVPDPEPEPKPEPDPGTGGDTGDTGDKGGSGDTGDPGGGSDEADGSKGGLSPAAIAGISLGGAAGVGLIALAVVLVRRRLP